MCHKKIHELSFSSLGHKLEMDLQEISSEFYPKFKNLRRPFDGASPCHSICFRNHTNIILLYLLHTLEECFVMMAKAFYGKLNNNTICCFFVHPSLLLAPLAPWAGKNNAHVSQALSEDINKFSSSLMIKFIAKPFNVSYRKNGTTFSDFSPFPWFICDNFSQSTFRFEWSVYLSKKPNSMPVERRKMILLFNKIFAIRMLYVSTPPPLLSYFFSGENLCSQSDLRLRICTIFFMDLNIFLFVFFWEARDSSSNIREKMFYCSKSCINPLMQGLEAVSCSYGANNNVVVLVEIYLREIRFIVMQNFTAH